MSDRPSLPNSYSNHYSYQQEAYTPPGYQDHMPAPRTVTERREPYVPPQLGGLQSYQGASQARDVNPPAAASASAVQVPPGHPFSGTNDDLIRQFGQLSQQTGMPSSTRNALMSRLRHFANWAGDNSLQKVLNSTSSTYAQQAVRDWCNLPANENPYGSAGRGSHGGGAISAFRRSFGWGRDDA